MSTTAKEIHANSKKVTILRKTTMAEKAQDKAPDFMAMSRKSIGSYFASKNEKGIGSGLTFEEKEILMPRIIDVPKDDRTFLDTVRKFFESLQTYVPYEDGVTLEIGLTISNDEELTYFDKDRKIFNVPIAPMDYIRYRHALHHPQVAESEAAARGNMLVSFYIFDPASVLTENIELDKTKDRALQIYMTVKTDIGKVDALLTLMGRDPREFSGLEKNNEKIKELRSLADNQANKFVEEYEGKMFEEKYLLTSMMNTGIVRRVGNQYINAETGKIIGNNTEEAWYFFKDPAHTDQISILKANLQEALKKESKVRKQRTPLSRL